MPTYHRLILVAALCLTPVWASAKTEITWMQYLHGIHYFKYHGKYNLGFDYKCRSGGIFHPITNYRDVPPPSRKNQVWRWYTPSTQKSWSPVKADTGPNIGFTEKIGTINRAYILQLHPNLSIRGTEYSYGSSGWSIPRVMRCVPFAVVAGGVTNPRSGVYGPNPGWHYYQLGTCQGAGHRGIAYEAQGRSRTYIYCVDRQYILYSFNLDNKKFWQSHVKQLQKVSPQLAQLAKRMWIHPSKESAPWLTGYQGPSYFFALDQIGGVKINVPPSWWKPNNRCLTLRHPGYSVLCGP